MVFTVFMFLEQREDWGRADSVKEKRGWGTLLWGWHAHMEGLRKRLIDALYFPVSYIVASLSYIVVCIRVATRLYRILHNGVYSQVSILKFGCVFWWQDLFRYSERRYIAELNAKLVTYAPAVFTLVGTLIVCIVLIAVAKKIVPNLRLHSAVRVTLRNIINKPVVVAVAGFGLLQSWQLFLEATTISTPLFFDATTLELVVDLAILVANNLCHRGNHQESNSVPYPHKRG